MEKFSPENKTVAIDCELLASTMPAGPDPAIPVDGFIVPKGVWHRVDILEPSQIVYLTPGPNGKYRPLADDR
ncbi:MAG: hypothetical protein GWN47_06570 [Woeseiaceae bacterium]|nr:hypothetical protein [Woeseiaceae bacterium]